MQAFLFISALLLSASIGFVLAWRGMHWAKAWLVASLFIPASLWIAQVFAPTPWFGVALFFGSLAGIFLGGAAVLAAHLAAQVLASHRAGKRSKSRKQATNF